MIILVLNCGSSSIKYQLFEMGKKAEVIATSFGDEKLPVPRRSRQAVNPVVHHDAPDQGLLNASPKEVDVHPFFFFIDDSESQAVLSMGRLVDPTTAVSEVGQ